MRSSRLALTVTAFALLSALTACSGDSDDSSDPAGSTSASQDPATSKVFEKPCTVEVDVTGATQASWTGEGTVTNTSGTTAYTSTHGKDQVVVYSGTDDIPTSANLTIGGATFTTTDPDVGLDVAADGSAAEVDAVTSGIDGAGPQLTATFTCGKGGKAGKAGKGGKGGKG